MIAKDAPPRAPSGTSRMIRTLFQADSAGLTWLDVTAPTSAELVEIAATHGLHATSVEDCLDPAHLPKFERFGDSTFMILRTFGPDREGLAVQDMTRKIAVFTRGPLVLTIHRRESDVVERVAAGHLEEHPDRPCNPTCLAVALTHEALASYDKPLDEAEETLDQFEAALFGGTGSAPGLRSIHLVKGRVSLVRRLLWLTIGVVGRLGGTEERTLPMLQDLRESVDAYHFHAEQVLDAANNLLSMQLALGSHRTNEVVRVLTLFSAFFLPLTFIVGVYGMNFTHMPELTSRWGYPMVVLVMAAVCLLIFLWFRQRGWLRRPPED